MYFPLVFLGMENLFSNETLLAEFSDFLQLHSTSISTLCSELSDGEMPIYSPLNGEDCHPSEILSLCDDFHEALIAFCDV